MGDDLTDVLGGMPLPTDSGFLQVEYPGRLSKNIAKLANFVTIPFGFGGVPETIFDDTRQRVISIGERLRHYGEPVAFLFASLMAWDTLSPFYLMNYLNLSLIQFGLIQLIVYGTYILSINLKHVFTNPIEEIFIKIGFLSSSVFYGYEFIWISR